MEESDELGIPDQKGSDKTSNSGAELDSADNFRGALTLFWESLTQNKRAPEIEEDLEGNLSTLTLEKLRELTWSLSQSRKNLNQQLEVIQKQIESHTSKLETLKLVGARQEDTVRQIEMLNEVGQKISNKLFDIDEMIKLCRHREEQIHDSGL